ncbi:hypothetical protein [Hyphomicrobium sp. CS1GBMeth3]|uniref:hypothetical protein n=1 Tax=Hyphomicrobium sp. CS1GBMeth3 TaxID=1892845 RepID=UPI0009308D4E|nr:hypothetical protein [Hyphomicrobium sp. CS1GBMeth3]
MSKKVKPLHDLAGDPGNPQDVSDLQQMLAQTQAELAAERKSNKLLKKTVETLTEQRDSSQSTIAELRQKLETLEDEYEPDEVNQLRDRVNELEESVALQGDDILNLIQIREKLFRGDAAIAREDLDILLNRVSPSWRCGGCNVGQLELY